MAFNGLAAHSIKHHYHLYHLKNNSMRSTFKILPYINKKRIKPDGTCAVLCRVSIDGKNILITTGITCRPEDWDSKKGGIRTARENNRLAEWKI